MSTPPYQYPFPIFSAEIAEQIDREAARHSPRTRPTRTPQEEFDTTIDRLRRFRRASFSSPFLLDSDEKSRNISSLKEEKQRARLREFVEHWGVRGLEDDRESEEDTIVEDDEHEYELRSGAEFGKCTGRMGVEKKNKERPRTSPKRSRALKPSESQKLKHSTFREMAVKTHTWISLWFLITTPIIFWDIGYCFMRPRSMLGGDLHWIWKPYEIYERIDLLYGPPAFNDGDGFTNAQSLMNLLETLLNLTYLYLAHITAWPPATLIGFTSASLTLAKTVLYWAQEYYCNFCATGQNTWSDLIVYWILPNGFWIVVPAIIVYVLGQDLCAQLTFADKAAQSLKVEKKK